MTCGLESFKRDFFFLLIRYESPPGIKQNMLRTYESWDADYIAKGTITRAQVCSHPCLFFLYLSCACAVLCSCCLCCPGSTLLFKNAAHSFHKVLFSFPLFALIERVHYFVRLDQVLRIFICGSSFGRGYYRCYLLAPHQRKTTTAHSSGYFFFVFFCRRCFAC